MKIASGEDIPALIGTPFDGGIYLGRFFLGAEPFALIGALKAEGELGKGIWHKKYEHVAGALSVFDGRANTLAMAEAGSPIAQKLLELRIGGREDWYLMSRGEGLLAHAANLEGAEAFDKKNAYWTSTQNADDPYWAWFQWFYNGLQD